MSYFRGRAQQQAQAAVASAPPPPATLPKSDMMGPSSSRVNLIQSKSTLPSNPFTSANPYVDFDLPKTLGKVVDLQAAFALAFSSTDASGTDVVVMPSQFFVQSVDLLLDGKSIERVEAPEIFNETAIWCDDQQFNLNRNRWNISSTGGLNPSFNVAANTTVNQTWYLPLTANCLMASEPFLKGMSGQWTIRLYMAANIVVSAYKTGTTTASAVTVALQANGLQVYATEANLSASAEASLVQAHIRGANYKTVTRTKFYSPLYSSIPNNGQFQLQLTGFSGSDSAGLVTYVQANNPTLAQQLSHYELQNWQLRDSKNVEVTIILPEAIVQTLESQQVPINSASFNSSPTHNLTWSFCSNLKSVIDSGRYAGRYKLTGQETLLITPVNNLSSVNVVVVSYDYAYLSVKNGVPSLVHSASQ